MTKCSFPNCPADAQTTTPVPEHGELDFCFRHGLETATDRLRAANAEYEREVGLATEPLDPSRDVDDPPLLGTVAQLQEAVEAAQAEVERIRKLMRDEGQ